MPDELRRHSLSDGAGGQYSTNLDRNRYGQDDQYLSTVIRYDLEFLRLCPCLVDVEIVDAKRAPARALSTLFWHSGFAPVLVLHEAVCSVIHGVPVAALVERSRRSGGACCRGAGQAMPEQAPSWRARRWRSAPCACWPVLPLLMRRGCVSARYGTATCLVSAGDDFCTCGPDRGQNGGGGGGATDAAFLVGAAAATAAPAAPAAGVPVLPPGAMAAVPWPSPGEVVGVPVPPGCEGSAHAPEGAAAGSANPSGSAGAPPGGSTPSAAEGPMAAALSAGTAAGDAGEAAAGLEPTKSGLGSDLLGMLLQAATHGAHLRRPGVVLHG